MSATMIVLGLVALGAVAAILGWSRSRGSPTDLGFVSHHWLAEHRLSQTQDPQR